MKKQSVWISVFAVFLFCGSLVNCGSQEAEQKTTQEAGVGEPPTSVDSGSKEPSAPDTNPSDDNTSQDNGTPDSSSPQEKEAPDDISPKDQGTPDDSIGNDTSTPERPTMGKRPYPKGMNILFIGHSFFVPPSRGYNDVATKPAHKDKFTNHEYNAVMRGGENGAPGALWKNTKAKNEVLQVLRTGKVEVLAMTAHISGSEPQDYQRWIDEALKANKNTKILISCPWPTKGSSTSVADYDKMNETNADLLFTQVVVPLRKANNGVEIHYLNHGKVAAIIKSRFKNGTLKSATKECCSKDAVFSDTFGHGGNLIVKTAGYFILSYWSGFLSLSPTVFPALNASEMTSVVKEALLFNQKKGYILK